MKEAAIQKRMITWTSLLVLVVGVISFFVMVEAPPNLPHQARRSTSASREPASIDSTAALIVNTDQAIDVSVDCAASPNAEVAPSVVQISLHGTSCGGSKSVIESSEIVNATNGFSATVFYPKAGSYTSDYITLSSGVNNIRIVHFLKKGGRETHALTVSRTN